MPWDFSIYPELKPAQKQILSEIGLTLFYLQGLENSIEFMLDWVFPEKPTGKLAELYTASVSKRRQTLGQLLAELRKRTDVNPQFDSMLAVFLEDRNRFVHRLFNEREFNLVSDESCTKASQFMTQFQQNMWDISNLVMAYNLLWTRHFARNGDPAGIRAKTSHPHLSQVDAHFLPVLDPKQTQPKN
jgi:hypothetical protein